MSDGNITLHMAALGQKFWYFLVIAVCATILGVSYIAKSEKLSCGLATDRLNDDVATLKSDIRELRREFERAQQQLADERRARLQAAAR